MTLPPSKEIPDSEIQKRIEETERSILEKEIKEAERAVSLKTKLPHLHGFKHYKWSRSFFESRNKFGTFLLGANQISKSSVSIRKCIHWATEKPLWKKLWNPLTPNQFWYLYPTKEVATAEFHTKWMQFMPQAKEDPIYGWRVTFGQQQHIKAIHFNSGVTVYFKTYAQDVQDLQTGTVFAIFCDEELPVHLLGELQNRLNATDGYFHMAFTATLGQDYWRKTMEPLPSEKEEFPEALKLKVSLYDCLEYEDGTKSYWTRDRIERIKNKQATTTDILIRVYGKFAKSGGRKYEAYDAEKNRSENHPLPKDWHIYSGVDPGSGGEEGHPAGIIFVAVDPLFRRGRVFRAWRGDGIPTTSGDIYVKYVDLRDNYDDTNPSKLKMAGQYYDFASAEFRLYAESAGDYFEPAEKKHDIGERVLNTLFKHKMLSLQINDPEIDKLSTELETLLKTTPKKDAFDNLADALRYAVTKIPWDFAFLDGLPVAATPDAPKPITQEDLRRGGLQQIKDQVFDQDHISREFAEWNGYYGT